MGKIQKSPAWEDLTFANNFLFCKIMESEPELCRQILEMLLNIEIERLEPVQAERTMLETTSSEILILPFSSRQVMYVSPILIPPKGFHRILSRKRQKIKSKAEEL